MLSGRVPAVWSVSLLSDWLRRGITVHENCEEQLGRGLGSHDRRSGACAVAFCVGGGGEMGDRLVTGFSAGCYSRRNVYVWVQGMYFVRYEIRGMRSLLLQCIVIFRFSVRCYFV